MLMCTASHTYCQKCIHCELSLIKSKYASLHSFAVKHVVKLNVAADRYSIAQAASNTTMHQQQYAHI